MMSKKWDVSDRQIRRYIKKAEKEWQKYSDKRKINGMSYTLGQLRKLKDQAHERKIVIGREDNNRISQKVCQGYTGSLLKNRPI
jgi:transcriptional antiterminator